MKKIIIEGGSKSIFDFLDNAKDLMAKEGWQRDREKEKELGRRNRLAGYYATIEHCIMYPYFPRARIFFILEEQGYVYVSHMESLEETPLSREQYDRIVLDFHDIIVKKAQMATGVSVVLSD